MAKVVGLIAFALLTSWFALVQGQGPNYDGAYRQFNGPTAIVAADGSATTDYCDDTDILQYNAMEHCICECFVKGYNWYYYIDWNDLTFDKNICTCTNSTPFN